MVGTDATYYLVPRGVIKGVVLCADVGGKTNLFCDCGWFQVKVYQYSVRRGCRNVKFHIVGDADVVNCIV